MRPRPPVELGDAPTQRAASARPLSIELRMTKSERGLVELLNLIARHNRDLMWERPDLPLLYESGVRYQREPREIWSDYLATLEQGHEDCDALAAARAGELMAWGHEAMSPVDGGFAAARRAGLRSIPAWVQLHTRGVHGSANLYHCVVIYRVLDQFYRDDPSARLGMYPDGDRHPFPGIAQPF